MAGFEAEQLFYKQNIKFLTNYFSKAAHHFGV
jgi:hypothetical protein